MASELAAHHQLHGVQPVLTVADEDEAGRQPTGELRIHVGHDLDALCHAYRGRGAHIVQGPTAQPWGLREFVVLEPNGHHIRFCAEAQAPSLEFRRTCPCSIT